VIRLDVGSGGPGQAGRIGVDLYAPGAEVAAPMWDLPYDDGTVDEIYSSHALEHVAKAQVVPTLAEWHRALKAGGRLIIQVPDLVWCCEQWLEHRTNDWWMDIIFGNQEHEGEFHKTGFTRSIMEDYLRDAGFCGPVEYEELQTHCQRTLEFRTRK
jgi:predicted SAM-dependent methyltransferase